MGTSATSKPRSQERAREPQREGEATPISEWVAAGVGLLLVLATLAVLGWLAINGRDGHVEPVLQVVAIERQGDRHHVTLLVENAGATPAAALRINARLLRGESVVEQAQVEFDYLPAHSSRNAGVFFRADPRQMRLELSVESYREP